MTLLGVIADGNRFLGIEWDAWKVLGWIGNALFASRFFVQWLVTEKRKQVVIPISFWWLSLTGSLLLLIYGLHKRDSVFIFAYAFTWIPYIRNIVIHHRTRSRQVNCASCGHRSVQHAIFCHRCGVKLPSH